MATIDQVEQLRKRAQVSYQDAKEALEACDDDLLEALIYLERQGKVKPPKQGGSFSTKRSPSDFKAEPAQPTDKESFRSLLDKFFSWVGRLVRKGNKNYLHVYRKEEHVFSLPITAFVLIGLFAFQFTSVVLLIGLITGFRYYFRGPDIVNPDTPPGPFKEDSHE